jgi:small subunit ribosomal protein S9
VADTATKKQHHLGTGRRKTSVARVRLHDGTGKIVINGRSLEEFFTEDKDRNAVVGPLVATEMRTRLDMIVKVHGGGITGQAGAICQGVARACSALVRMRRPTAKPPAAWAKSFATPASSPAMAA